MTARRKGRPWLVASLSLALHALVLAWLARPAAPDALPEPPAMTVELVEPVAAHPRPRAAGHPSTLARMAEASPQPASPSPVEVAPAGAPTAPSAAAGPVAQDGVRAALRASFGCTRPAALNRQEREACAERLGRLGPATTAYAAPMDPAKRAYFDEVVAVGPTGGVSTDEKPGAVTPDHPYARVVKCSIPFGPGKKKNDYQGAIRLGRAPCSITLQGSVFTPEAMVRKR